MKPLLIVGASSFGQLMAVLADDCSRSVAGFVDDTQTGPLVLGTSGDLGLELPPAEFDLILAIGYKHLQTRFRMFERLRAAGFHFPTLVHPTARVSSHAVVGKGCLIMAGTDIDAFTSIGNACVLWPHVTVSHDNRIGHNTFISPAATLCGFVSVGPGSFIGANSTIVDGSTLGDGSFVKAATRYHTANRTR